MAKKKQEQEQQGQEEHVMAVLDKRTNKTAVVSKMNEQQQQLPKAGPHITVGTVLHEFQEPVQQSHKFQFLPYPSRCIGKDPECRHPDPKGGRPRTGRQKTGREQ